jgi:hypothetical protein
LWLIQYILFKQCLPAIDLKKSYSKDYSNAFKTKHWIRVLSTRFLSWVWTFFIMSNNRLLGVKMVERSNALWSLGPYFRKDLILNQEDDGSYSPWGTERNGGAENGSVRRASSHSSTFTAFADDSALFEASFSCGC